MAYLDWGNKRGSRHGGIAGLGFRGLGRFGRRSRGQVATGYSFCRPNGEVARVRATVHTVAHLWEEKIDFNNTHH